MNFQRLYGVWGVAPLKERPVGRSPLDAQKNKIIALVYYLASCYNKDTLCKGCDHMELEQTPDIKQPEPEFTQLESDDLRHMYTLIAFLDDTGPVGWDKLREFEENLPNLDIEQTSMSNIYTFKDGETELGRISSTYILFGMTDVQGQWGKGYHKFANDVNHALTTLELFLINEGVLSEEDLAELSQDEPQL